ncbi:unnamed protein product [Tuber melanosporum]|uniref:4-aminobutyrate aminotransferase n=1 Tax=Tuber melanosporum (strain Mel28) TaxID=656061 RepID=D5GKN6_TUBMM|nr:uncharacterized protein GSTUM_00009671001 [Tuber melanosporum]CAZ85079.1 unnamed protein product [Tuber melanosporum]
MASTLRHSSRLGIRTARFVLPRGRNAYATVAPFFSNEPIQPSVMTPIPGPVSRKAIEELDSVFDTRSLNMICDYKKSVGNYLVDMDGNVSLPIPGNTIASIPVGYNNPRLIAAMSSKEAVDALVNRPALGGFPPAYWASLLKTGILAVAPKGLDQVFTAMAGSDAIETSYKAAFIYRRRIERGEGVDFTPQEIESVMKNQAPGSPELTIMSFKKAFHGRLFGSLSTTRSKPVHKLDIPSFDWPQASFPRLEYPLEDNIEANKKEEERCLAEVEDRICSWPIAAVVVEPIQSEGGDNHASPAFFQGLRDLTKKKGVLLIVDEVQTGVGATGKFWAHEHWNLESPPDMVTFSKKAQTAGYYFGNPLLRPNLPYRQFNTWMGDPVRAILFRAIIQEIAKHDLIKNTAETGDYLYRELEKLASSFPERVQNLRGKDRGTFIAFDTPERDALLKKMKTFGVNIGGSGETAVRLRPMLVFQKHHG